MKRISRAEIDSWRFYTLLIADNRPDYAIIEEK